MNTTNPDMRYDVNGKEELLRIEKYSFSTNAQTDPLETAVQLVRNYPDLTENLPLIAVLATAGKNEKLSISAPYTAMVVTPAALVSSIPPTYALADGMNLIVTTQPDGVNVVTSTYTFNSWMFLDITHAQLTEVISAINLQALWVNPYVDNSTGVNVLGLRPGNQGLNFPNTITVTGGTAVTALGFTNGQTATNYGTSKSVMNRYHMAASFTVSLEVAAESENVRTDVVDLLYDYLTYALADNKYQLYGRSIFDQTILDETYQIIVRDNEITLSGNQEIPRAGDPYAKIYMASITVPCLIVMYSDRINTASPALQKPTIIPSPNIFPPMS